MVVLAAHYVVQGQSTVVFAADHPSRSPFERDRLLATLIFEARRAGMPVDKAAILFQEWGRINYRGAPDLVAYLANNGLPGDWNRRLFLN